MTRARSLTLYCINVDNKGSSIKDVRTRRKGGFSNADAAVLILPAKGKILQTWGGGGGGEEGKKWQNLAEVLYGWPVTKIFFLH